MRPTLRTYTTNRQLNSVTFSIFIVSSTIANVLYIESNSFFDWVALPSSYFYSSNLLEKIVLLSVLANDWSINYSLFLFGRLSIYNNLFECGPFYRFACLELALALFTHSPRSSRVRRKKVSFSNTILDG